MRHVTKQALFAGAALMERKGEDDDPVDIVTKSIEALTKSVGDQTKALDDRLKVIETKAADDGKKLVERLDKIEAKAKRPGGSDPKDDPDAEAVRKSFGTYLRLGNQTPVDEIKALTVSSDPQAGYLAPPEMSTEFIRDLVEYSPIRSYASVRTTGAPSVKYPKRTSITNAQWEDELEESQESTVGFGMLDVAHMPGTTTFAERRKALDDALREVCVFRENTLQALREKARCAERYMHSADLPRPAARALVAALLAFGGAHAE